MVGGRSPHPPSLTRSSSAEPYALSISSEVRSRRERFSANRGIWVEGAGAFVGVGG